MTNKEIRRRAWELCREKFGLILSATFLMSLISTLMMETVSWLEAPVLSLILSVFLMILSAIMSIGLIRFMLDIWHGETPKLAVLFSQKHRLGTMICVNLLICLICIGVYFAAVLVFSAFGLISTTLAEIAIIVGMVVALILLLWVVLRFEMAQTCIVIRPSCRATECLRIAWRASKGNVRRLFCNTFVLGLPLLIAQGLLIGYETYLLMSGQMLTDFGYILLDIGSVLISALLNSYIYLGTFPLHEQLLETYFANHPWNDLPAAAESAEEYTAIPASEENTEECEEETPNNPPEP